MGPEATSEEIDTAMLNVFRNFAKYLVDFFKFPSLGSDYILKKIEREGFHYLDKCLSEGKGAIIVSAHLGNWELAGAAVAILGYPLSAIILEHKDKRINDFFTSRRTNNNMKVIPLGMQLKKCFTVVRSNELLAIVSDKDYTGDTEQVEFFGRKTCLPRGAAAFSIRTGAPILPCFMTRERADTFRLQFEEPIRYERSGDYDKDVRGLMERYVAVFERVIRAHPDQWYAFEKVWDRK
jgi:KDO2-lipid IV(A) lauroyltransferase